MDAQERERGIGHGVDEPVDQVSGRRAEVVVVAAERHDALAVLVTGQARDPIRLQPGAGDDSAGDQGVLDRRDQPSAARIGAAGASPRPPAAGARPQSGECDDLPTGEDPAAALLDPGGKREGEASEVHDPGLRDPQGPKAVDVRLDLPDPFRPDLLDTLQAVRLATLPQRRQAWQLGLLQRDHQLPRALPRHVVLVREPFRCRLSFPAQPCLQRPGPVVEARVEDAAVVPRLVGRELGLLLEHGQADPGRPFQQCQRRGEPDDPAAHDRDVEPLGHRAAPVAVLRVSMPSVTVHTIRGDLAAA